MTKRLRVGYLTYGLDRDPTGIGRYAIELVRAMAHAVDDIEILLLTTEREDPHGLWQQFERHPLRGCHLLPALMSIGNGLMPLVARHYQLDILHDPNGIAPFLSPRAGERRVVTLYDAFAYVYPAYHNWLDNWRYRWHLPYALRNTDAVTTISDCSRQDLLRYLPVSADRLYLTVPGLHSRFQPVADTPDRRATLARYAIRTPYILYTGGINARKNIARLFEAYAQLRHSYPSVMLVIGGKRQWKTAEIDATFERLHLDEHVHFTGYVDDDDLPALYSAAEVFVFPSLYEGFGLPPLEAMACGAPVVTSHVSSLPEVVGNAALMIDPTDSKAIAIAISQVLQDSALATDLRAKGILQAQRFTWEQTARQTIGVYHKVVGGS